MQDTRTATDMTPEGPATGDKAIDHQVGHPADHLHVAIHIIDAPGDTEAPHHYHIDTITITRPNTA